MEILCKLIYKLIQFLSRLFFSHIEIDETILTITWIYKELKIAAKNIEKKNIVKRFILPYFITQSCIKFRKGSIGVKVKMN